jgi:hypothetical protein
MLVLSGGMLRLAKVQPAPEGDPATRHAVPRIRAFGQARASGL